MDKEQFQELFSELTDSKPGYYLKNLGGGIIALAANLQQVSE